VIPHFAADPQMATPFAASARNATQEERLQTFRMTLQQSEHSTGWKVKRGTAESGKLQSGNSPDADLQAGSGEAVARQLDPGAAGGLRHVNEIIADQRVPLNFDEQEKIQADLLDEVFGLGPLEPLLRDPKISDILVNDKDHVFIEKGGLLQQVDTSFRDDRHLLQIIDRIVSRVGRRVDESSPMVDARLPDGSRVNAIIPPLALDGPSLSIRRFGTGPLAANSLVELKSISAEMMEVLASAVKARISI
jgi:hypothetical protein